MAQAKKAIDEAKASAVELNTLVNISIVDVGANLVSFARTNGTWLGFVGILLKKAKTARFLDMPLRIRGILLQLGGSLFGIEHSKMRINVFSKRNSD